jgi:uncharacterized protein
MRLAFLSFVFLILVGLCFADDPPAKHVDMEWSVKIPLRDGVHLNATIYRAHEQKDPLPVIFTLTPYIGDSYLDRATYFSRSGYVYALVDVRGRGNSEGRFEPFANEGRDGYDIVEWRAKQTWCNGKVAMWGGSYAGFDQWSTLKEFPPHLATIVPAAAAHPAVDFPFFHGIFTSYVIQWLTFTSGVTGNSNTFGNSEFWNKQVHRPLLETLALPGTGWTGGKHYHGLSQVVGPSHGGCLLECYGANPRSLQEDRHSDPDNHGALRRRPHFRRGQHAGS